LVHIESEAWWASLPVQVDVDISDITITGLHINWYPCKSADYSVVNLWCPI